MEKALRLSDYNLVFPDTNGNELILTNTITKAILRVERTVFELLQNGRFDELPAGQLKALKRQGVVIPSGLDELLFLKAQHLAARLDPDVPSIHICPTLDCNFSCPYCFESPEYSGVTMAEQVVTGLIRYFEKRKSRWRAIGVRWFGGEPLLAIDQIQRLSAGLISVSAQNGIPYQATMATNGYLLDEDRLQVLKSCRVTRLQITLDGMPEVHDRRRFETASESTFTPILNNIALCLQKGFDVVIRINIDHDTYPTVETLLQRIDSAIGRSDRITLFTWPTNNCGYRELDTRTRDTLYRFQEYASDLEPQIIRWANAHGFLMYNHRTEMHFRCPLFNVGSFYIDPLGYVYKCGFYLGITGQAYGRLLPDGSIAIINPEKHLEPWKYDPFAIEECRRCKVLPYCYGKCPVVWERNGRNPNEGCVAEKFTLRDRLFNIIECSSGGVKNAGRKAPL
jgi:uncharacterized protein